MTTAQIILPYKHTEEDLHAAARERFGEGVEFRIHKRSVDARQHRNIKVLYSITTDLTDPAEEIRNMISRQRINLERHFRTAERPAPVVAGTGPAGLFCAYWLLLHGFKPIVVEQGPDIRKRMKDIARFMKHGELHPYSNICFGAGGAGTYSDGKLITRIRSPFISFVMATFVDFGAPEHIRYLYNPHLGSNRIRKCISGMLEHLIQAGADIRYETRLTDFVTDSDSFIRAVATTNGAIASPGALFLATGHSARETYALLRSRDAPMGAKEFAMGIRVEHPAKAVSEMIYGKRYWELYPGIETAQYKLAKTWKEENRAVYSFCMCPGGYLLNSSTTTDGVVTNGMSNSLKLGRFSNAAIVVNISINDMEKHGYSGIDAGLEFQKNIEELFRASVNATGKCNVLPCQRLTDFIQGKSSRRLLPSSAVNPVATADIHRLLPDFMYDSLHRGFAVFEEKLKGFRTNEEAQIFGVESRTSAPYQILRDEETLVSPEYPNLYPVGEGAGFAGGITSAAVDGVKSAQAYFSRYIAVENP